MSIKNFKCICGNNYNEKSFEKHFKICNKYKNNFIDLDFKISLYLRKYNPLLVKFLLMKYIELIDHNLKRNEGFEKEINITNDQTTKEIDNNNINKKNINFKNNINNKSNENNYEVKYNNNNINSNINNSIDENIFNSIESNIFSKFKKNSNKNDIQIKKYKSDVLNNKSNQKINDFKINNNYDLFQNNEKYGKNDNYDNASNINYFKLIFVGSGIKKQKIDIILNCTKNAYLKNKGCKNDKLSEIIMNNLKNEISENFQVFINDIEINNDINLTLFKNQGLIHFIFGNKKFYIISLK